MTVERRSEPRQPQELQVRLDGPKGRARLIARDISSGGLFVETPTSYPLGQILECRLEVPEAGRKLRLDITAEVRHQSNSYHTEDGRGPFRGLGLRFIRMDAEVQAALQQYLRAQSIG